MVLENFITRIVLRYLHKYVKNISTENLRLSVWGGDLVLKNLELRLDVLEEELGLPVAFTRGFVKELILRIPWASLGSKPVEVVLNGVECVLVPASPEVFHEWMQRQQERMQAEQPAVVADVKEAAKEIEATESWTQSLVQKIISNLSITVNNAVAKFVDAGVVATVSLKNFRLVSASLDGKWTPCFVDLSSPFKQLNKLCEIKDLTVCLDQCDDQGWIDSFQDPVMRRTSATIRVTVFLDPTSNSLDREDLASGSYKTDDKGRTVLCNDIDATVESLSFSWSNRQVNNLVKLLNSLSKRASERNKKALEVIANMKKRYVAEPSQPKASGSGDADVDDDDMLSAIGSDDGAERVEPQETTPRVGWRSWAWNMLVGEDSDGESGDDSLSPFKERRMSLAERGGSTGESDALDIPQVVVTKKLTLNIHEASLALQTFTYNGSGRKPLTQELGVLEARDGHLNVDKHPEEPLSLAASILAIRVIEPPEFIRPETSTAPLGAVVGSPQRDSWRPLALWGKNVWKEASEPTPVRKARGASIITNLQMQPLMTAGTETQERAKLFAAETDTISDEKNFVLSPCMDLVFLGPHPMQNVGDDGYGTSAESEGDEREAGASTDVSSMDIELGSLRMYYSKAFLTGLIAYVKSIERRSKVDTIDSSAKDGNRSGSVKDEVSTAKRKTNLLRIRVMWKLLRFCSEVEQLVDIHRPMMPQCPKGLVLQVDSVKVDVDIISLVASISDGESGENSLDNVEISKKVSANIGVIGLKLGFANQIKRSVLGTPTFSIVNEWVTRGGGWDVSAGFEHTNELLGVQMVSSTSVRVEMPSFEAVLSVRNLYNLSLITMHMMHTPSPMLPYDVARNVIQTESMLNQPDSESTVSVMRFDVKNVAVTLVRTEGKTVVDAGVESASWVLMEDIDDTSKDLNVFCPVRSNVDEETRFLLKCRAKIPGSLDEERAHISLDISAVVVEIAPSFPEWCLHWYRARSRCANFSMDEINRPNNADNSDILSPYGDIKLSSVPTEAADVAPSKPAYPLLVSLAKKPRDQRSLGALMPMVPSSGDLQGLEGSSNHGKKYWYDHVAALRNLDVSLDMKPSIVRVIGKPGSLVRIDLPAVELWTETEYASADQWQFSWTLAMRGLGVHAVHGGQGGRGMQASVLEHGNLQVVWQCSKSLEHEQMETPYVMTFKVGIEPIAFHVTRPYIETWRGVVFSFQHAVAAWKRSKALRERQRVSTSRRASDRTRPRKPSFHDAQSEFSMDRPSTARSMRSGSRGTGAERSSYNSTALTVRVEASIAASSMGLYMDAATLDNNGDVHSRAIEFLATGLQADFSSNKDLTSISVALASMSVRDHRDLSQLIDMSPQGSSSMDMSVFTDQLQFCGEVLTWPNNHAPDGDSPERISECLRLKYTKPKRGNDGDIATAVDDVDEILIEHDRLSPHLSLFVADLHCIMWYFTLSAVVDTFSLQPQVRGNEGPGDNVNPAAHHGNRDPLQTDDKSDPGHPPPKWMQVGALPRFSIQCGVISVRLPSSYRVFDRRRAAATATSRKRSQSILAGKGDYAAAITGFTMSCGGLDLKQSMALPVPALVRAATGESSQEPGFCTPQSSFQETPQIDRITPVDLVAGTVEAATPLALMDMSPQRPPSRVSSRKGLFSSSGMSVSDGTNVRGTSKATSFYSDSSTGGGNSKQSYAEVLFELKLKGLSVVSHACVSNGSAPENSLLVLEHGSLLKDLDVLTRIKIVPGAGAATANGALAGNPSATVDIDVQTTPLKVQISNVQSKMMSMAVASFKAVSQVNSNSTPSPTPPTANYPPTQADGTTTIPKYDVVLSVKLNHVGFNMIVGTDDAVFSLTLEHCLMKKHRQTLTMEISSAHGETTCWPEDQEPGNAALIPVFAPLPPRFGTNEDLPLVSLTKNERADGSMIAFEAQPMALYYSDLFHHRLKSFSANNRSAHCNLDQFRLVHVLDNMEMPSGNRIGQYRRVRELEAEEAETAMRVKKSTFKLVLNEPRVVMSLLRKPDGKGGNWRPVEEGSINISADQFMMVIPHTERQQHHGEDEEVKTFDMSTSGLEVAMVDSENISATMCDPCDLRLSMLKRPISKMTSLHFDTHVLMFRLGYHHIGVIKSVVAGYVAKKENSHKDGDEDRERTDKAADKENQTDQGHREGVHYHTHDINDFTPGLFRVVSGCGDGPSSGEIAISGGQSRSRTGAKDYQTLSTDPSSERGWICWKYAYPHFLSSVSLAVGESGEDSSAVFCRIPCILRYFDELRQEYVDVAEVEIGRKGQDWDQLNPQLSFFPSFTPQARVWQLCWQYPKNLPLAVPLFTPQDLVTHSEVRSGFFLKPSAPLSIKLTASNVKIFLVEHVYKQNWVVEKAGLDNAKCEPALLENEMLVFQVKSLVSTYDRRPHGSGSLVQSVVLRGQTSMDIHKSGDLTYFTVLHPSSVRVIFQIYKTDAPIEDGVGKRVRHGGSSTLLLQDPPIGSNTRLDIKMGVVDVKVDTMVVMSILYLSRHMATWGGKGPASFHDREAKIRAIPDVVSRTTQGGVYSRWVHRMTRTARPYYVMRNSTDLAIHYGQVNSRERLCLRAGEMRSYSWVHSSYSSPNDSNNQVSTMPRLRVSLDGFAHWSDPVAIDIVGISSIMILGDSGLYRIRVKVELTDFGLLVTFLPSHRFVNATYMPVEIELEVIEAEVPWAPRILNIKPDTSNKGSSPGVETATCPEDGANVFAHFRIPENHMVSSQRVSLAVIQHVQMIHMRSKVTDHSAVFWMSITRIAHQPEDMIEVRLSPIFTLYNTCGIPLSLSLFVEDPTKTGDQFYTSQRDMLESEQDSFELDADELKSVEPSQMQDFSQHSFHFTVNDGSNEAATARAMMSPGSKSIKPQISFKVGEVLSKAMEIYSSWCADYTEAEKAKKGQPSPWQKYEFIMKSAHMRGDPGQQLTAQIALGGLRVPSLSLIFSAQYVVQNLTDYPLTMQPLQHDGGTHKFAPRGLKTCSFDWSLHEEHAVVLGVMEGASTLVSHAFCLDRSHEEPLSLANLDEETVLLLLVVVQVHEDRPTVITIRSRVTVSNQSDADISVILSGMPSSRRIPHEGHVDLVAWALQPARDRKNLPWMQLSVRINSIARSCFTVADPSSDEDGMWFWSDEVDVSDECAMGKVRVRHEDGNMVCLSYSVQHSRGQVIVVFFRDPQSQYVFINRMPFEVAVGLAPKNRSSPGMSSSTPSLTSPSRTGTGTGPIHDVETLVPGAYAEVPLSFKGFDAEKIKKNDPAKMFDKVDYGSHKLFIRRADTTPGSKAAWSRDLMVHHPTMHTVTLGGSGVEEVAIDVVVSVNEATRIVEFLPSPSKVLEERALLKPASRFTFTMRCTDLVVRLLDETQGTWAEEEFVLVSLSDVKLLVRKEPNTDPLSKDEAILTVDWKTSEMQVDNQIPECRFPVIVARDTTAAATSASSVRSAGMKPAHFNLMYALGERSYVRRVVISMFPMSVQLEDNLARRFVDFVKVTAGRLKPVLDDSSTTKPVEPALAGLSVAGAVYTGDAERMTIVNATVARRLYLESLELSELTLILTVHLSIPVYLRLNRTPLSFDPLIISGSLYSPRQLSNSIISNYIADAIIRSPALVGSLELLGNPTGLVSTMSEGVRDLLQLPFEGIRGGPSGIVLGFGMGVTKLVWRVSDWSLNSVAGLSSSLARNVDRLSFDPTYVNDRLAATTSRPDHVVSGLARGVQNLGRGVFDGVTGIVSEPVRRAAEGGAMGLMKGVGMGLLGAVAKPVSGALDAVSQTSEGIISSTGFATNWHRRYDRCDIMHPLDSSIKIQSRILGPSEEYVFHAKVVLIHDGKVNSARGIRTPRLQRPDPAQAAFKQEVVTLVLSSRNLFLVHEGAVLRMVTLSSVATVNEWLSDEREIGIIIASPRKLVSGPGGAGIGSSTPRGTVESGPPSGSGGGPAMQPTSNANQPHDDETMATTEEMRQWLLRIDLFEKAVFVNALRRYSRLSKALAFSQAEPYVSSNLGSA